MDVDFSTCLVFNTRMAARAVTRRYDALLRPHGLTSAQFSLLGNIRRGAGTITELADQTGIERTGLTRTLDRLHHMGLVVTRPAEKGNGRVCNLTDEGEAVVEKLIPIWLEAQAETRKLLSKSDFSTALDVLKRLSRL